MLKETLISNIFQEDYGDAWIQPDVDEFIQKKHEQSELLEFVEKESETEGENSFISRDILQLIKSIGRKTLSVPPERKDTCHVLLFF